MTGCASIFAKASTARTMRNAPVANVDPSTASGQAVQKATDVPHLTVWKIYALGLNANADSSVMMVNVSRAVRSSAVR